MLSILSEIQQMQQQVRMYFYIFQQSSARNTISSAEHLTVAKSPCSTKVIDFELEYDTLSRLYAWKPSGYLG